MAWLTADEVASKQQRQQPWQVLQKQHPGLFEEEVSSAATSSPADSCESSVAADSPTARRGIEEDTDESVDGDSALPYYASQLTREEEEVLMGVVLKTVAGPMDATGELYIRMCKAFDVRAMDQVCRPLVSRKAILLVCANQPAATTRPQRAGLAPQLLQR